MYSCFVFFTKNIVFFPYFIIKRYTKCYQRASILKMTKKRFRKVLAYCVVKGYIHISFHYFCSFFVLLLFNHLKSSIWNSIWFVYVNNNIFCSEFPHFSLSFLSVVSYDADKVDFDISLKRTLEVNINFENEKSYIRREQGKATLCKFPILIHWWINFSNFMMENFVNFVKNCVDKE